MTYEEALRKLRALQWTEEIRPGHPWYRELLVNRNEVEDLLKEVTKDA